MKLRAHLVALVVELIVPLVLCIVGLGLFLVDREQAAVEQGVENTARALSSAFDRAVGETISTLGALAVSRSVDDRDIDRFRSNVRRLVAARSWKMLTLGDTHGTVIIKPYPGESRDSAVISLADTDYFGAVAASGKPAVATVPGYDGKSGSLLLATAVPVVREGSVRQVLTAYYDVLSLDRVFAEQQLDPRWTSAVLDRGGTIIARSHDAERFVGQPAPADLTAASAGAVSGRLAASAKDGAATIGFFIRSPLTGWVTMLAVPREALLTSTRQLAWTIGIVATVLLMLGLAVSAALSRRIAAAAVSLNRAARALGRGEALPALPVPPIRELREVGRELENASRLLQERQRERDAAEAGLAVRLRQEAELAALGIEALRHEDLDAFLTEAAPRIAATIGADCCNVMELQPDGAALTMRAGFGWQAGMVGQTFETGSRSQAGYALAAGAPVVSEDFDLETRFDVHPALRAHAMASGMSVVIHGPWQPFGVLGAHARARHHFTSDDLSFLQAVANVLSTAISRHRAADALARSEERHRRVIELARELIWIHADGKIVFANPFAAQVLGVDGPERLVGQPVLSFAHPDDRPMLEERTRKILDDGQSVAPLEARLVRPDGGVRVIEFQGMPFSHKGRPAVLAVGRDVTGRRRAEDALRHSERRFRDFAEAASDWFWEADADLRLTYSSKELLGEGVAVPIGARLEELPPHVDPAADRQHWEDMWARRPFRSFRYSFLDAAGDARHLRMSGLPAFDGSGQFLGYRGVASDVTAEVETQARLHQAQKMEAVGQLTGGIAHDFNNLLAVIIGNADMLLERMASEDKILQTLASQIEQAGLRGAGLTQRLLAFSRRQALRPRTIDVNEMVRGMEPLLQRTLGETIEVRTTVNADLWKTLADPGQVENSLLNLAVNARDAMPNGGCLSLETANVTLDDSYSERAGDLRAGDYVVLAVSDTGTGMPPEVRQRAFEPFFTTKEPGKGTGLGLSMVYGFVKQSGGHVTIYSEVGVGTTIKIYLPRARASGDTAEPGEAAAQAGNGETVLLVEDDAAVRGVLEGMLAGLGYVVVAAADGTAAIEALGNDGPVDAVVTDVVMPGGIDGWELAQRIWRDSPDFPILFVTGYTDNVILQRALMDNRVRVLSKPFRQRDLAVALRQVLDG